MEAWWIVVTVSIVLLLKAIHDIFVSSSRPPLPPGPFAIPLIGNIQLITSPISDISLLIQSLTAKFGPLVTLRLGSRRFIFISDPLLAHEALIQKGTLFADRPPPSATEKLGTCDQHNISSAYYGPKWRLFRANLTSGILHSSRQISNSLLSNKVLELMVQRLRQSTGPVQVLELFSQAIFFSHALICLGEDIDYRQVMELQRRLNHVVANFNKFPLLDAFPNLSKLLLRGQWKEFQKMLSDSEEATFGFIQARRKTVEGNSMDSRRGLVYLDTLLSISEEKQKLTDPQINSFCSEFLVAAVDTTSVTLQWLFANLVKQPDIQEKLLIEIQEVVGKHLDGRVIELEHLGSMKYLKAVVLETLRRHPPTHLTLPHAVSQDVVLAGRLLPRNSSVLFAVRDIGLDPKIWEEPMEFRPERFVDREEFDIKGMKRIEMIPFGAGRRMCPGYNFALHQLEYLVANLVWRFQWKQVEGVGVDLTDNREFLVGMKNPLQVYCVPRTY